MAESVLAAAALGGEAYEYNHTNFKYDRKQRLMKDYKEIDFRIEQAKLWREDVDAICELIQKKSKTYCLVAVLVLQFSMSLWCQGRLPMGTPSWVMAGNQVAAGSGFLFLTMVIWLAMYASVAAQGYTTRLLTQLIRLPIPTWEELEACRTYSSGFEKMEARQMFRIPFLTGAHEGITGAHEGMVSSNAAVDESGGDVQRDETTGGSENGPCAETANRKNMATDPWGLEARGDDRYELGCKYGADVAAMRHIKLMRHAAIFWQSYDAFARMSLNIGMNQVIVGLSYFILGYMAIDLKTPYAAFSGVMGLMCVTGSIASLDMSLSRASKITVDCCLVIGPVFGCIAAYQVSGAVSTTLDDHRARLFMSIAFFAHGLFLVLLAWTSGVKVSPTGDSFPASFKTVLWLDAFAYVRRDSKKVREDARRDPLAKAYKSVDKAEAADTPEKRQTSQGSAGGEIGYYAMDYMELDNKEVDDKVMESAMRKQSRPNSFQPGLNSFGYDARSGKPTPLDYNDHAPPGAEQDMRHVEGAPRMWNELDPLSPGSEFFDAALFFPKRNDDDDLKNIVTGHDREVPALLPQKAFRVSTFIVGLIWWLTAAYQILDVLGIVDWQLFADRVVILPPSLLQTGELGPSRVHGHMVPQKLAVNFPSPAADLKGLSCDGFGHHFSVTDGLTTFWGELKAADASKGMSIDFQETDHCTSLLGEAFDDTAISCTKTNSTVDVKCDVLVLHRNGKRMTTCPIQSHRSINTPGHMAEVSQQWLRKKSELEQVGWLYLDPDCEESSPMACAAIGTTHGRVARLSHFDNELSPESVLPQDMSSHGEKRVMDARRSGVVRNLNRNYVGVLQSGSNKIQVLDLERGLTDGGSLSLPVNAHIGSFCAAGGHVYALSEGPMPEMWRFSLPDKLRALSD